MAINGIRDVKVLACIVKRPVTIKNLPMCTAIH